MSKIKNATDYTDFTEISTVEIRVIREICGVINAGPGGIR